MDKIISSTVDDPICFFVGEILGFKGEGKASFLHYAIDAYLAYTVTEKAIAEKTLLPNLDENVVEFILNIFDLPFSQEYTRNNVSLYLWEKYLPYLPFSSLGRYKRNFVYVTRNEKNGNTKKLEKKIFKYLKHKLILEQFAFVMFCKELIRNDIIDKSMIGSAFTVIADKFGLDIDTTAKAWMSIASNIIKLTEN